MGLFPLKSGTELILPNYGIHTPAETSEDFYLYLLEHKKRKPESCLESTTSCHSELHLKASLMAIEIGITRWQSTKETGEWLDSSNSYHFLTNSPHLHSQCQEGDPCHQQESEQKQTIFIQSNTGKLNLVSLAEEVQPLLVEDKDRK